MSRLALVAVGAALLFLYVRSPIDLVPDRAGAVGLLDDLIVLIVGVLWLRRMWRQAAAGGRAASGAASSAGADDAGTGPFDPYEVLGVSRDASPEEIRRAYHAQLRSYHPDRVDGLGEDLRALAHRRTIEIRRAYDALKA